MMGGVMMAGQHSVHAGMWGLGHAELYMLAMLHPTAAPLSGKLFCSLYGMPLDVCTAPVLHSLVLPAGRV